MVDGSKRSLGLAVSLPALGASGCLWLEPIGQVVRDVHVAEDGTMFVEHCTLRHYGRYEVWMDDCEVDIAGRRDVAGRAPRAPSIDFPREDRAAPSAPLQPGTLGVISFPLGASIEVDGSAVGEAPLVRQALAPGLHTVKAAWPDGVAVIREETVAPARSTTARLFRP